MTPIFKTRGSIMPLAELQNLTNKNVIDISVNIGDTTKFLKKYCKSIHATDIRTGMFKPKDISFSKLDVEDIKQLTEIIKNKDVLTSFGLFYHLQSHWNILKTLCYSDLQYFFIETLCGLDSPNPTMIWGLENTQNQMNAYSDSEEMVMHGVPNMIWIAQTVKCFGASVQLVVRRYEKWRVHEPEDQRWRMLIKIVPNTTDSFDVSSIPINKEGTWTI